MPLNRWKQLLTTTSLKLNMLSSGAFWFINILTSLILIRIVLRYVSLSEYGYWAAFLAITSYFTLSDLGLGPTITKYISNVTIPPEKKKQLVTFILLLESLSATILAGGIFIFYLTFYHHNYFSLFIFLLIGQFFTQMGMNLLAILNGLQKIFLSNVLTSTKTLIYFFLVYFTVSKMGIFSLAFSFTLAAIIFFITAVYAVSHYFHPKKNDLRGIDKVLIKKALSFSSSMFILKIVGQTRTQFDRIILSLLTSPELTAIVDLAKKLIGPVRGIYISFISPVFPVFSQLHSQANKEKLRYVFYRTITLALIVLFISFATLGIIAKPLVDFWLGPQFEKILPPVYILIISEAINLVMYPVNLKIIASDQHSLLVKFVTIMTTIQLTLSLLALYFWNYLIMLSVFAGVEFIKFIIWLILFKSQWLF